MDAVTAFLGRTTIDLPVTVFRLILSLLLGGAIGVEREWHRQSAGLRTHMVICLGSTLLTLMSIYLPQTFTHFEAGDPGASPRRSSRASASSAAGRSSAWA